MINSQHLTAFKCQVNKTTTQWDQWEVWAKVWVKEWWVDQWEATTWWVKWVEWIKCKEWVEWAWWVDKRSNKTNNHSNQIPLEDFNHNQVVSNPMHLVVWECNNNTNKINSNNNKTNLLISLNHNLLDQIITTLEDFSQHNNNHNKIKMPLVDFNLLHLLNLSLVDFSQPALLHNNHHLVTFNLLQSQLIKRTHSVD